MTPKNPDWRQETQLSSAINYEQRYANFYTASAAMLDFELESAVIPRMKPNFFASLYIGI